MPAPVLLGLPPELAEALAGYLLDARPPAGEGPRRAYGLVRALDGLGRAMPMPGAPAAPPKPRPVADGAKAGDAFRGAATGGSDGA